MLKLYSLNVYYPNQVLKYIVKCSGSVEARNFLLDHLKNCECRVGEFVFFEKYYEVSLFDNYDPEILINWGIVKGAFPFMFICPLDL